MKILNGKEAFEAMMAGRKIMCRAVGELMDFDDLDRFPATIFAMPGYEFSIKVETMELAGVTFAKPLTLDDVVEDQEIFIVHPDHVSLVKYSKQNGEYFACVRNGFAQADNKNAVLQLEAMGKLFGRVICYSPTIDNTGKAKKKRSTKVKSEVSQPAAADLNDAGLENIPAPEVLQPVETVSVAPSTPDENVLDETDPVIQKFIDAIDKCSSDYDLQGVERNLDGNQHKLCNFEYEQLKQRIAEKRESFFEAKQPVITAQPEPVENEITETEQPSLIDLIDDQAKSAVQDTMYKDAMSGSGQSSYPIDMLYNQKKKMLISKIQEMDSIEALERLAPAIPAAKLNPEDHQELLRIYAECKTAMQHADAQVPYEIQLFLYYPNTHSVRGENDPYF